MISSPDLISNNITYPKLVYNPLKQQLMIFGSSGSDKIWSCDIRNDQLKYKWTERKITMPLSTYDDYYDILIFNNIIIVFYFAPSTNTDIWCFDFLTEKWFKSEYATPIDIESQWNMFVVRSLNYDLHLLDLNGQKHFQINLYTIIPMELRKLYLNHYQPLIVGYIKQMEIIKMLPDFHGCSTCCFDYYPPFD